MLSTKYLKIIILIEAFILLGCFLYGAECLNGIASKYTKLIEAINVLFTLLISLGLFFLALKANKIAEVNASSNSYQVSKDSLELLKVNYDKVAKAREEIVSAGEVTNLAMNSLWDARDDARLFLPKDIVEFTEVLRKKAVELKRLQYKLYPAGNDSKKLEANSPERVAVSNQKSELIDYFTSLRIEKPYRKHIITDFEENETH